MEVWYLVGRRPASTDGQVTVATDGQVAAAPRVADASAAEANP